MSHASGYYWAWPRRAASVSVSPNTSGSSEIHKTRLDKVFVLSFFFFKVNSHLFLEILQYIVCTV